MTKILMVCLGNICRSPVAEGIMRHKAMEHGLDVEVDSAGTSAYHIGETPDSRSQQNAIKHGVDISHQRARQFSVADFDAFDYIFAMDRSNFSDITSLARNGSDLAKVDLILNVLSPGSDQPVPDPYYGAGDGFETVFKLLDEACEEIVRRLQS